MSARALHLIAEAEKLAFADRDALHRRSRFRGRCRPACSMPATSMHGARADRSGRRDGAGRAAGAPPQIGKPLSATTRRWKPPGTSHFSIVDGDGNVLAMTTTIEAGFGSRLWAAGFLLNNELTDFSFRPVDAAGRPLANAVAPGKRPRSSMAPTIVFDEQGKPWAALGSPGGSRIILYVVKTLVGADRLEARRAGGGGAHELRQPRRPVRDRD